jgi:hypothetical protein
MGRRGARPRVGGRLAQRLAPPRRTIGLGHDARDGVPGAAQGVERRDREGRRDEDGDLHG